MMHYFKVRIRAWLKGWKNQPRHKEVSMLFNHYRNEIMDKEMIDGHFDDKDFKNLLHIARYANMGLMTAIQAAFCLGYIAGRDGAAE